MAGWQRVAGSLVAALLLGTASAAACEAPAERALDQAVERAKALAWAEAISAFTAVEASCPMAAWQPAQLDRLHYAELQTGRDEAAAALLPLGRGREAAVMAARQALERDAWGEAAALPLPAGDDPEALAILHYARALGAARSGQAAAAAADLAALDGGAAAVTQAWTLLAEGQTRDALALMQAAAEKEDAGDGGGPAANPLLPYRELLADMRFESGDFSGALRDYEISLGRAPARMRAFWGAGRAAESAGDHGKTQAHYAEFAALCKAGTCVRPGRLTALKRSMAPPY